MAFYFNGKAATAHEDYSNLKDADTIDWTEDQWTEEWGKVDNAQGKRDLFMVIGIGVGSVGAIMFVVDWLFLGKNEAVSMIDNNIHFAINNNYEFGYMYRW